MRDKRHGEKWEFLDAFRTVVCWTFLPQGWNNFALCGLSQFVPGEYSHIGKF